MSTEELANVTFSSQATIVRMCKKLGAKNFNAFKLQFLEEYLETEKLDKLLQEESITETSTINEIVNILPNLYEHVLKQTKLHIDASQLKRVANKLNLTHKIDIYGLGISYTIAQQATFKFQSIGVEFKSGFNGINEHYISNLKEPKKRMAILISITGKNPMMIKIANYLKQRGIFTVGISTSLDSEFSKVCDETFQIDDKKLILSMEVLPTVISAQYLIDIMFSMMLTQRYEQNVEASLNVIKQPFSQDET